MCALSFACLIFLFLRSVDVTFVPPPQKAPRARVSFNGDNGKQGAKPLGLEALLDTCNLNNAALWCTSQAFFRNGVLVPRAKLTTPAIEQRLSCISQLYPINDKARSLGMAVHEKENLRGFHLFGDDDDIAKLWSSLYLQDEAVRGWDVNQKAMCWTASAPGTVFVPYLDLDEKGAMEDFHRVWTTRVLPTVITIQRELRVVVVDGAINIQPVVFFNFRPIGELYKFSFHLHWPSLGVENIMHWKSFLLGISDMPRRHVWTKKLTVSALEKTSWEVKDDDKTPIWDPAVYGGRRQLFRGPFCGKGDSAAAVMIPCAIREVAGVWEPIFKEYDHAAIVRAILNARIAKWPEGLTMLSLTSVPRSVPVHGWAREEEDPAVYPSLGVSAEEQSPLMDFVNPFLFSTILPKWQAKRRQCAFALGVRGAVVPTENLRISKNVASERAGVRFLAIEGDTFCEMDPAHVHTQSHGVIGIEVDFTRCTIRQTCFACAPNRGSLYCFLHTNNRIEVVSQGDSQFTSITHWQKTKSPHQLLLDYHTDIFIHQRATRTVWVFDRETGVWRSDIGGNMVIGKMIDELNEKHIGYLKAYKNIVIAKQIAARSRMIPEGDQDGAEIFLLKQHNEARKFMSDNSPFISMTAANRGKVIDDIRSYNVKREAKDMNAYPHLIPMKNKKYYNVYTGETGDMEADHLFTSCVNAELTMDNEEIKEIEAWFREISTGDVEKCLYLKRIAAYCFTFLEHDRKFYVLWGSGQNGKGMTKEFIMKISQGPEGFDSRAKNLLQAFWSERGNANQSPENCTPESYELMNKTFFYTDDIAPIPLDVTKVKRTVGSEPQSGRGLYGKPVDIKPRGKVMWTTNALPNGPGEDNAYWDRAVYIKMLAKYSPDVAAVDPARYRFAKDHCRYLRLLELLDAFFSVCVRALTEYYQSLEWDPMKKAPRSLGSFPLPTSVRETMTESRALQLPLAAFIRMYTQRTPEPLHCVSVEELFKNYLVHLENINEGKTRRNTTQNSFTSLMASALDVHVVQGAFEGVRLMRQVVPTMKKDYDNRGGSAQEPRGDMEHVRGESGWMDHPPVSASF